MEQVETILQLSELLSASLSKDEAKVKAEFKQLCEVCGFITKGVDVDLECISKKANELIRAMANASEESVSPALKAIGSLLGLEVSEEEPEEGNESNL